jgi:cobalt/nickel transport system permease protein
MHIPDGYLGPQTYGAAYAVMLPIWVIAGRKVSAALKGARAPLLGLAAAFSFVVMMINVPIPGGTTGHATGAALIAILLGPAEAIIAVTVALVAQALVFGDGGITAIGANCLNMAVVMPLTAYGIFRLLAGKAEAGSKRRVLAAAVAGYISLNVAALTTAIMFGIQPAIAHDAAGKALYAPYPLAIAVPAMMLEHLALFGFAEAIITGLALKYLEGVNLGWKPTFQTDAAALDAAGGHRALARWFKAVVVLIILSPLGILVPAWLGAGSAWGEWSGEEIQKMVGYLPSGMSALTDKWKAPMPDYAFSWQGEAVGWLVLTYIIAAVIGVALLYGFFALIGKLFRKPKTREG